jgi:hypothetical protein
MEGDAIGIHSNIEQYATQGLPWKDWRRLQRYEECCRCHHLQEGQAPVHREASQPESRARLPVPIARRVRPTSQEERRAEEEVEGGRHPRSLEETTPHAAGVKNNLDEGQRTRDRGSDRIRDNHLSFLSVGVAWVFFPGRS